VYDAAFFFSYFLVCASLLQTLISSNTCHSTDKQGYKAPEEGPSEYQSVPLSKIEDFGVHAKHYYPLEVSYFK
jgi:hypothetical protein